MDSSSLPNALDNRRSDWYLSPNVLIALGLLLLPYVVFYWMVPPFSDLTIGNDYGDYPIQHQMELAYSLEHDSFPLYVPGFAGGQSAAALTLGQIYHPLAIISRFIPGYWEGDALRINSLLRLFSLGLCHVLVFSMLRRLGLNLLGSLLLSFIAVYNLRMLDNFRYGASLENHTGYLALCALVVLRYLSSTSWLVGVGIALSSYLLAVGGHPQISYIGFLGGAFVTLMVPFFVTALKPEYVIDSGQLVRYWLSVLVFVLVGALLAMPYILGLYFDFISQNTTRVHNDYAWATGYQDTWAGSIRNLYAPLKSDVHGAFGGSSLLLLLICVPFLLLFRQRVPAIILAILVVSIAFFLVCMGDFSPLHYGVWKFFPLADKFRVPGRFSLWLIFPLLFLLAWLFKEGQERTVKITCNVSASPLTLLSGSALVVLLMFNLVFDRLLPASGPFNPDSILRFSRSIHDWVFYSGIVTLIMCGLYGLFGESQKALSILLAILLITSVVAQVTLCLRHGTWVAVDKPQKTLAQMSEEKRQSFKSYAIPGFGLTARSADEQMEHSAIEPNIARVYRSVAAVPDDESMWAYIATKRGAHEAVVLADEKAVIAAEENETPDTISLLEASYNQLVMQVTTVGPSFVATHMPYRKNWRALLDGEPVDVYRANGNETGVFVPAGSHRLVFYYESPETVTGLAISFITFLLLLWFVAMRLSGRARMVFMAIAAVLPPTVFYSAFDSLYSGTPIETHYEWSSQDLPAKNNLAYFKKTSSSPIYSGQMPFFYYSGLAVDGDPNGHAFTTAETNRPSWVVDLGARRKVQKVRIHGLNRHSLPVTVLASDNAESYRLIAQIRSYLQVHDFDLEEMELRYFAIRSDYTGVLSFTEVEILGAQPDA